MRIAFIFSVILSICSGPARGQEVVIGLYSDYTNNYHFTYQNNGGKSLNDGPAELPFFDDFSNRTPYPDSSKWSDNYVFINNNYSDRQVTTGIATFDALDGNGRLYETAVATGFEGDMLTSRAINLEYTVTDNIILSFFYQAGGLGDMPELNDSLTLQFFAPDENKWYSVWRTGGATDSSFRQAVIPVTDQRFLLKGFRFRFTNYVTISPVTSDQSMIGNSDHWNIDYVLLDRNRDENDTTYADVAFRKGIRSLLKNHESLPWAHFREIELQEMGAFIPLAYRNNDAIVRNVTRNFEIHDDHTNVPVHSFTAGAVNIDPRTDVDYNANLIYTFSGDFTDSARFRITCILKTDEFDPKGNDTIVYRQIFKNYIAYDDGTSEMGYGINGLGSRNAMVACRFTSFIPDTLRSVRICFNDSFRDANKRSFDLLVWDDNNGIPGNVIYRGEEVMVEQAERMNGFYNYGIIDGVPVNGVFYVGWKQRSETFLNAGLDINTNQKGRQFYWLNGEWQQSQVTGSIMIRPVLGKPEKTTSVHHLTIINTPDVTIFPNPARDVITVRSDNADHHGNELITIYDLNGRTVLKCINNGMTDISSLPQGIYIVTVNSTGRLSGYSRLVKIR